MGAIGGTSVLAPTPGATVTITIDPQLPIHVAAWVAGEVETVVISGTPADGQMLTVLITNDATLGRVITFGTGFSSAGIATGVISKRSTVTFLASSGVFYEVSRTIGVLT